MIAGFILAVLAAATPPTGPLANADGAFFALSVPDADQAATWYSEKLGLKAIMKPPAQEGSEVLILGGGGLIVELIERGDAMPLRQAAPTVTHDAMVHGVFKAGVIVKDWDALLAGLKARDIPIALGPFAASAEQRANLIIRDNNGNYIQFISNRPAPAEAAE